MKINRVVTAEDHIRLCFVDNKRFCAFLEKSPTNIELKLEVFFDFIKFEALQLNCKTCKINTTFKYVEPESDIKPSGKIKMSWEVTDTAYKAKKSYQLIYLCGDCCKTKQHYFITLDNNVIRKNGQEPDLELDIPHDIVDNLGEPLAVLYKKGKECESKGLGIAAMAYYRRVIEDKVKSILDQVKEVITKENNEDFLKAIEGVDNIKTFKNKSEAIYKQTPELLKPNGVNLLYELFGDVSEGLHHKNDEECLEIAVETSRILELLITRLNREVKDIRDLQAFSLKKKK